VPLQHARALEAFIRFIPHCPHLVPPLVASSLRAMGSMALDAPGSEPPPAHMTHAWKAGFEARMALASVVTNVAKVGPMPSVPAPPVWDCVCLQLLFGTVSWAPA